MDKESLFVLSFVGIILIGIIAFNIYNNAPPATWVSFDQELPHNKVCMVNNTYLGVQQIEVPVDEKMYYGCCEMCVDKLNRLESVRFGTDPLTGEQVDKANAFIVLKSKTTGEVHYFLSEENFEEFKSKSNEQKK